MMDGFWKNEWNLFKNEMNSVVEFFMQPVTFSSKSEDLFLKPAVEETVTNMESTGFWKQQFNMFAEEYDSVVNYLMQPVKFK